MLIQDLIPILQCAIGPAILVSGVGLLLLTMTNRLGRIVDRVRILQRESGEATPQEREPIQAQLKILSRRAHVLRLAISLATISVLLSAILIISLFFTVLLRLETALVIAGLFVAAMAAMIGSLIAFLRDVDLSLEALKLELRAGEEAEQTG